MSTPWRDPTDPLAKGWWTAALWRAVLGPERLAASPSPPQRAPRVRVGVALPQLAGPPGPAAAGRDRQLRARPGAGGRGVAGDKFRLGRALDDGVLLLGRRTWQLFARLWPGRDGAFAARMDAVPKLVASRSLTDASAWANSRVLPGDLADAVKRERRDVVVTGSLSVVRALMAGDLVDEYRLLTFPAILGAGERLVPAGGPPAYLECRAAEQAGAAVFASYGRGAR